MSRPQRREATILHADLDAFFASVEQRDDPSLRGRPMYVGPGVVLAASYEARAFGLRSGMGAGKARRLCPQAIAVEARFTAYVEASDAVFALFEDTAPVVEKLSIDEAFLDVAGLERISGSPAEIARRLRREVREQVGLPITVGVATTHLLAKVASGEAKPDGLLVVPPDTELAFLHPLPVERLWGIGPSTTRRLNAGGIATVGEAAALPEAALIDLLGQAGGRRLHALAHNRDPRPVRPRRSRRSFGSQSARRYSASSPEAIHAALASLVDRVTRRMRAGGRTGRTVVLRLRFADYTRASRSRTLSRPTAATKPILAAAHQLLTAAMPTIERRGLTLIGITVSNLQSAGRTQLELPVAEPAGPGAALDATLDGVRDRFGSDSVQRGVDFRAPRSTYE